MATFGGVIDDSQRVVASIQPNVGHGNLAPGVLVSGGGEDLVINQSPAIEVEITRGVGIGGIAKYQVIVAGARHLNGQGYRRFNWVPIVDIA